MNQLERSRQEIDEIDSELVQLFERRMHAVQGVAAWKKEQGLPILDGGREAANIARSSAQLRDPELKPYFEKWYRGTMEIAKEYQRSIMERQEEK